MLHYWMHEDLCLQYGRHSDGGPPDRTGRHDEESHTYDPGNYACRLMHEACANKYGIPPRFQFKDKGKI